MGCSPILAGLKPANDTTGSVGWVGTTFLVGTMGGTDGGTAGGGGKMPDGIDIVGAGLTGVIGVIGAIGGGPMCPVGGTAGPNSGTFSWLVEICKDSSR